MKTKAKIIRLVSTIPVTCSGCRERLEARKLHIPWKSVDGGENVLFCRNCSCGYILAQFETVVDHPGREWALCHNKAQHRKRTVSNRTMVSRTPARDKVVNTSQVPNKSKRKRKKANAYVLPNQLSVKDRASKTGSNRTDRESPIPKNSPLVTYGSARTQYKSLVHDSPGALFLVNRAHTTIRATYRFGVFEFD